MQNAGLIPFTADRSIPEEVSFRKYVVDEAMKILSTIPEISKNFPMQFSSLIP